MTKEARFKSGKFEYHLPIRMANSLFGRYARKPFDAERLMARAQKTSGLTDFGDDFFVEPLKVLVEDINQSTTFHPIGAFLYKNKMFLNLVNRLWAQYWIKTEPKIVSNLPPSLLITGLQRTGTTFLQRMIGNLPEFRGVISWEIVNPVPKSKKKNYYGKYQASIGHHMLNYLTPEFKSIHSVSAESLEEEVALMDHTFMGSIVEASLNVPNYAAWLEQQDHHPAYMDLKRWLQLLLWREPAQNYLLLKSPHHMEHLDHFVTEFPNTKIIQTHRTPVETLGSFCSMVHFGKKIFMPFSDPHQIGKHWLRKDKILMDQCLAFRQKRPDLFMDIAYKNLVTQPIETLQTIYDELGLKWTNNHTALTEEFCRQHKKNKYGRHIYALEDYGLSENQVKEEFKDYLNEYEAFLS